MKNDRTPTLNHSDIFRVGPGDAHSVRVLHGTAYITTEGDAQDHFLSSGDEIEFDSHRLTLIQGWPEAKIKVC